MWFVAGCMLVLMLLSVVIVLILCFETQLGMIEEVFNLFDTDGQQQLDEEELASAIFALGFSQKGHVEVVAEICFYCWPAKFPDSRK